MKTYAFLVFETATSNVDIKAKTEQEARDKFEAFVRGDDDAEDFVMYAIAARWIRAVRFVRRS
jgi:hypothetical protein